jgi:GNAT superfamily N-acetyltransferase
MTVSLARVSHRLPFAFDALMKDAEADGHRHVGRLASEIRCCPAMFHAIFAAYIEGNLAGLGAITDELEPTTTPAWRMRRLYVHRQYRRRGAARAIALALMQEAAGKVRMVTVNAGNDHAARFWEQMGFYQVEGKKWTHETKDLTISTQSRWGSPIALDVATSASDPRWTWGSVVSTPSEALSKRLP